ncbi:MAG: homoserine dehydrogenase [Alphaproteobacteria bacterium]|nr:homoserine dehydrogenase [Alphaproteobacteria bacterium]
MTEAFRIGVAGLGTVGTGVVKILTENKDIITQRAGREIQIIAVSARDKSCDRGINLNAYEWIDNAAELAFYDNLDAVVELIGGQHGIAAEIVQKSLGNKLHVVTANKALLAHHGLELAHLAEQNNVSLMYEAAVAGGIPIIKAMREGLAANKLSAVYGILNGTCNYVLTKMQETGQDFADVLQEAQDLGYAEADPTLDVDGIDAAHKLCLLSSIAFGIKPDFDALSIIGISRITATDIRQADEFGYRIKLLGIARKINGKIMQILEPCLVPVNSPMGIIGDVYNAVYVEGDFVETPLLTGKGAGLGPTASSVVSDLIDLARGINIPTFGVPANDLEQGQWIDIGETEARYYMRMMVIDKPGVIASVAAILRDNNISIESMVQTGIDPEHSVPVILIFHKSKHADVQNAAHAISALDCCTEKPCVMRIEEL